MFNRKRRMDKVDLFQFEILSIVLIPVATAVVLASLEGIRHFYRRSESTSAREAVRPIAKLRQAE
jgi:hypothetical protein